MVICVHSPSVSDSVIMHAQSSQWMQQGVSHCMLFTLTRKTLEEKPAIVPFKATVQFDF